MITTANSSQGKFFFKSIGTLYDLDENSKRIKITQELDIYDIGIDITQYEKTESYLWTELRSYTHSITKTTYSFNLIPYFRNTEYYLVLEFDDSRKITIDNKFSHKDKLAILIPNLTHYLLTTRINKQIEAGQDVPLQTKLGKPTNEIYTKLANKDSYLTRLIVNNTGITEHTGYEILRWQDITDVVIDKGMINVFKSKNNGKGKKLFFSIPFHLVVNGYAWFSILKAYSTQPVGSKKELPLVPLLK